MAVFTKSVPTVSDKDNCNSFIGVTPRPNESVIIRYANFDITIVPSTDGKHVDVEVTESSNIPF